MTELFINGVKADLEEQSFNYTLQVNDFFDLKTRQSSFSENIKLPKTSKNLKIFDLAGSYPHNSFIPYQKNITDYLVDGVPVAINAFGILKNTDSEYNFHFYDGNIDLYKAIEKLKLTDLPLDEFRHVKDFDAIINTWDNDLNYVYAVADYGGQIEHDNGVNIDFLVPSISLEWLWQTIFDITGFEYTISDGILENKYFTISDAYKDVGADGTFPSIVDENEIVVAGTDRYNGYVGKYVANLKLTDDSVTHMTNGTVFTAPNDGLYDIKINITKLFPMFILGSFMPMPQLALTEQPNSNPQSIRSIRAGSERTIPRNPSQQNVDYEGWGGEFIWRNIELNAGDKLSVLAIADEPFIIGHQENQQAQVNFVSEPISTQIIYKEAINVSLADYLSNIQIKDLFTEILIQNALTPIIDKNGIYRFYTLDERLNAPIIDWSDKFSRLLNEDYVIGEYGQNNRFTYKYNEDGEDHNDGNIEVNNAQLKDENIINSKFYSAEKELTLFNTISMLLPEFMLWKDDVKETDNGTEISYKELKNHYHWLEVKERNQGIKLTSKGLGGSANHNKFKYADFDIFKWQNIINESYSNIGDILNQMSLIEVEVKLTPLDVYQFDFYSRIYIKELSSIFIPNKITFKPNELAQVQLIKIA